PGKGPGTRCGAGLPPGTVSWSRRLQKKGSSENSWVDSDQAGELYCELSAIDGQPGGKRASPESAPLRELPPASFLRYWKKVPEASYCLSRHSILCEVQWFGDHSV